MNSSCRGSRGGAGSTAWLQDKARGAGRALGCPAQGRGQWGQWGQWVMPQLLGTAGCPGSLVKLSKTSGRDTKTHPADLPSRNCARIPPIFTHFVSNYSQAAVRIPPPSQRCLFNPLCAASKESDVIQCKEYGEGETEMLF